MKTIAQPLRPRAAWLLLAAPALLVTPAFAQDATPAAPPPVRSTVPQASAPATPPPAAAPAPATPSVSTPADGASKTVLSPEAQAALAEARERPAARPARAAAPVRQATRTTTTRSTATQPAPAPAPAPAPVAPAPAPVTPAPEAAAPAPPVDAPAPVVDTPVADTAAPAETTETTATTETSGTPLWPLALIVVAILAIGGFFFMRSRRKNAAFDGQYEPEADYYAEPVPTAAPAYVEPTPAVAAVAAAPALVRDDEPVTATEEATIVEAEAEEVAALTDTAAPARNRPWLEFAMRPVRAGTNIDEALVEIELTVANSGSVAAQDVRVSAFMLTDANAGEMERMMIDPPADGSVEPVTIEPGEGTRIDATLAALKSDVGEAGEFTPVVVADARYRLPDGSEGRTSASFVVGITREGGTLTPIDLADRVMRDDIEARLHGEPQHA